MLSRGVDMLTATNSQLNIYVILFAFLRFTNMSLLLRQFGNYHRAKCVVCKMKRYTKYLDLVGYYGVNLLVFKCKNHASSEVNSVLETLGNKIRRLYCC